MSDLPDMGMDPRCRSIALQPRVIVKTASKYGYLPLSGGPGWIMCADDARFFNHSEDPTCLDVGEYTTARFDLEPGTELTSDYRSFCRDPFMGFSLK